MLVESRTVESGTYESGTYESGTYETYEGGSPEAELPIFAGLARDLMRVQDRNRRQAGQASPDRAFHAKAALGVRGATLRVFTDLPEPLRQGCFQPGAVLPTIVRFSNASGTPQADVHKDMRGVALRVTAGEGRVHDLLMTNFEVSPAANAREFVAMAKALAGTPSQPIMKLIAMLLRLPREVGLRATVRIVRNLSRSGRIVSSLASETYWSRGAILWGDAGPVRYQLSPVHSADVAPAYGADRLAVDLARRIVADDITFELGVQRYRSEAETSVEDTSKPWVGPVVPVAHLVIPRNTEIDSARARLVARQIDQLAFNPWNTTDEFRPLGNLNRARRAAYEASSAHRAGRRFETEKQPALRAAAITVAGGGVAVLGRFVPWHRLPSRLGLLNLALLRRQLQRHNLIDTDEQPPGVRVRTPADPPAEALLDRAVAFPIGDGERPTRENADPTADPRLHRTEDGEHNDLSAPRMGAVGATFGRNMPVDVRAADLPDPIRVSDELLARRQFLPATSLNVLAAAWIQFQVHDWVNHRRYPVRERSIDLPMPDGRSWRSTVDGPVEDVMRIGENEGRGNSASHWWDGSEVYGPDPTIAAALRVDEGRGAELRLEDGYLPVDTAGKPLSGFTDSWWLGLSVMQTVMAREHNAVCGALRGEYPTLSEDRIHQIARLVVSALIAKIHTVEWTPAILGTKTLDMGMNINWSGNPRDRLTEFGMRVFDPHALRGAAGTQPVHHGVPYALTEEFVTVYRMHPLIPDDYVFVRHADGAELGQHGFTEIQGAVTEKMLRRITLADAIYSLGIAHPGKVALHNFPRALREFERDGEIIDLAVVDIVRTRRRGVPRYNDFRAGLHMPRLRSFSQLTDDPGTLASFRKLYGSVDEVDTVVGLLAENPPTGFGFSDTAFRIFLLMASRRLQSDRFLTVDFRPEVYTPLGMDWIERNGFTSVLLRHCPELAAVAASGKEVFAAWP